MFVFSVVSNTISILVGSFLVTGRFRSTEQLLCPGISFYRDGDGSSRWKSEGACKGIE
jgi:hypothetical protein